MNINGTLKVGKKDYFLNYDINTLCMMKAQGLDIMKLQEMEIDIVLIRDLFYFGLCRFQKDITKEDVGEIMSDYIQEGHDFEEIGEIVLNALNKALGMKEDEEEEEGK